METEFEWRDLPRSFTSYIYRSRSSEFERWEPRAWVTFYKGGFWVNLNRVFVIHHLVGERPYIERKKYLTLDDAKRAVERKVPGMVAVVQLREKMGVKHGD